MKRELNAVGSVVLVAAVLGCAEAEPDTLALSAAVGDEGEELSEGTVSIRSDVSGPASESPLVFTPGEFGWPEVCVGDEDDTTLTLKNTGDVPIGPLTLAMAAGPAAFEITTDGCTGETLGPGAECTVDVLFTPGAAGESTRTLVATAPGGIEATVELDGSAATKEAPQVSSSTPDFGTVAVGMTSARVTLTLSLSPSDSARFVTASIDGPNAEFSIVENRCTTQALQPGGSCQIDVVFQPAYVGTRQGTLQVKKAGQCGPATTVTLQGVGESDGGAGGR